MSKIEHFKYFLTEQKAAIDRAVASGVYISEEAHWELVEDMKGRMGSDAANNCSDDEDAQEDAICKAEDWVSDNCSSQTERNDAAMALWLLGDEGGRRYLTDNAVGVFANHMRMRGSV